MVRLLTLLLPLRPFGLRDQEPHQRYVDDPAHYDREGRYLWWGC